MNASALSLPSASFSPVATIRPMRLRRPAEVWAKAAAGHMMAAEASIETIRRRFMARPPAGPRKPYGVQTGKALILSMRSILREYGKQRHCLYPREGQAKS
jgi:hypothetical protein